MGVADRPLVLVIDDDDALREICLDMLQARGYRTLGAASVGEGLRVFGEKRPAAVLLDLKLPDGTGLDVLRELQRRSPVTPVVVVSGYGSVTDAVEAMRLGAAEYIEKPLARERLYDVLDRALAPMPARDASAPEKGADGARYGMVGRSDAMQRVYQLVDMVSPTRARVLISGERGTGKELVARAIHALSPRRDRPFVQMNCAAVPAELVESEMFGHVKGAFTGAVSDRRGTFETADGGTLFLDEIGDMGLVMQAKLLRVLQEGELTPVGSSKSRSVDVRVLAATSKNLLEEIEKGRFRDDLYDRLNVVNIALPPLRARSEDVALLAEHYIRLASVENGFKPKRLATRAVEFLAQLPWRGNVRELRNLMERLAVIVSRDVVSHRDVMEALHMTAPQSGEDGVALPLRVARSRFERQYILERLSANRGNLGNTAKELGIERTNLYRKMKQLGIGTTRGSR
jgi:two-component system nitrogen regulation response regulator NtrX